MILMETNFAFGFTWLMMDIISLPCVKARLVDGAMFEAPKPSIVLFPLGQVNISTTQYSPTIFGNKDVGAPESITAIDAGGSA